MYNSVVTVVEFHGEAGEIQRGFAPQLTPSNTWDPWGKVKLRYVHYIIRQGKAELRILELSSVFHHLPSVGPKQLCALAHLRCTFEAGTS